MKNNSSCEDGIIAYRIDGASIATGMSESHIKSLIREGKLKSYNPTPKVRLILKDDLINYIINSKVESNEI